MARKAKEREVRLTVRVSESLVEALDRYGSFQQTAKGRKRVSRNQAVCEILEAALEDGGKALRAAMIGQLVVTTVKATEQHGATTLATLRELLAGIPRSDLDRILFTLEKDQALRLTQTHNGDIVTNRERSNGIHDPVRGDLLYAELPEALAKKAKRS